MNESKIVWEAISKTKGLIKENINMTEKLYDRLEKGEFKENSEKNVITLKKPSNVVNLKDKPNFQEIKLKVEEITEYNPDFIPGITSRVSESSNNSLDCEIMGESNKCVRIKNMRIFYIYYRFTFIMDFTFIMGLDLISI